MTCKCNNMQWNDIVDAHCYFTDIGQTDREQIQSCNIIGHLHTHSSSHNTISQCLLYKMSHTAVSLVLYAVDKGLHGRIVLQSLLLILLRIGSQSVHRYKCKLLDSTKMNSERHSNNNPPYALLYIFIIYRIVVCRM